MKRQVISFAVLLIVFGAVSANAQSIVYPMKVNVPFAFYVADKVLPQGEYTVSSVGIARQVMLAGPQDPILCLTIPADRWPAKNAAELVFHRIKNEYFLVQVQTGDNHLGYELFQSRHERELVAQAGKPAVTVLLASAR